MSDTGSSASAPRLPATPRAERGVTSFRRAVDEATAGPLAFGVSAAACGELDAWFAGASPRAWLTGPSGRGKTILVARWAAALVASGRAEVVIVPIARSLGTALERDALSLLYTRLDPYLAGNRSAAQVFHAGDFRSEAEAMIAYGRDEGELPLVVVLDGLDEAVDWSLRSAWPDEIGPGVRLLEVVETLPADAAIGPDAAHVSLPPVARDALVSVSPALEASAIDALVHASAGEALLVRLCLEALRAGRLMPADVASRKPGWSGYFAAEPLVAPASTFASLFGPIAAVEIPVAPAEVMKLAREPAIASSDDELVLRHPKLADGVPAVDRAALDSQAVRMVIAGTANPARAGAYVVEYAAAHLELSGAPLEVCLRLVTPAWMARWAMRPDGLLGFVSDVRSVRRGAARALEGAADETERARALVAVIRCALVEASIRARASDHERAPDQPGWLDREALTATDRPIGDDARRAELLGALAADAVVRARQGTEPTLDEALLPPLDASDPRIRMNALVARAPSMAPADRQRAVVEAARLALGIPEHELDEAFPIAAHADLLPPELAGLLFTRLVGWLCEAGRRPSVLRGDGNDLVALVPLLRRAGGADALIGAASTLEEVASWFP